MAKKTVSELEKIYANRLDSLKAEKAEKLKQAKALEARKAAQGRAKLRKQEAHIKILIGGYILAEAKKTKNVDTLNKLLATPLRDSDKELIKNLIAMLVK